MAETPRSTPLDVYVTIRRDVVPMEVNQGSVDEPSLDDFFNPGLPTHLKEVSLKFYDIARWMLEMLPASAQRKQGLWDLLRAKDCAVRAVVAEGRVQDHFLVTGKFERPDGTPVDAEISVEPDDSTT